MGQFSNRVKIDLISFHSVMISFGIMLILSGSMPWSQSLSFVTTVTMVTHSFHCNTYILFNGWECNMAGYYTSGQ